MGCLIAAILVLLVLLTPAQLTLIGRVGAGRSWQARLTLWGMALPVIDSKKRRQRSSQGAAPRSKAQPRAGGVLRIFRASLHTRGYLARHVRLVSLDVLGRIGLADAAAGCLLCGALNSLLAFVPAARRGQVRVRILPDFSGGQTSFQYRGIVAFRLGTILAGALMLTAAVLRARRSTPSVKEAPAPWIIRSAN